MDDRTCKNPSLHTCLHHALYPMTQEAVNGLTFLLGSKLGNHYDSIT